MTSDTAVQRGWRIDRLPNRSVHQLHDDRFGQYGLPLWLVKNGEHQADLELKMSTVEAEQLHAVLCHALAGEQGPGDAPPQHWASPDWGHDLLTTISGERPRPRHGWWIERDRDRQVHRLGKRHFGLPLSLMKDTSWIAPNLELRMSTVETEQLHAGLCRVMAPQPAPLDAPNCRLTERQQAQRRGLL